MLDEAAHTPYERFEPRIRLVDGGFVSLYAGDVAYDDETRFDDASPRHRFLAAGPRWSYERSLD